ncbi:hypothetical protein ON010_g6153 [Phytophthora cinnamomi]|nr:hypothetical protein ON010_g6153 [Phytophthora cinnamomi]
MDKVLRYFEPKSKRNIMIRDNSEVLLRNGGTSHTRFTATLAITGDGPFFTPHLFCTKLKNKTTVPKGPRRRQPH